MHVGSCTSRALCQFGDDKSMKLVTPAASRWGQFCGWTTAINMPSFLGLGLVLTQPYVWPLSLM
jgi:hypothetical protein